MVEPDLLTQLREGCAVAAARGRHVRVDERSIVTYAAALGGAAADQAWAPCPPEDRERIAAFWLTLDAINFGSGWFPTLRKPSGLSGYRTISSGLRRRFDERGPWSASDLAELEPAEIAAVTGQDPSHELIGLFAESLRDLGRRLAEHYDGAFAGPVDAAGGSAERLVAILAGWRCFADTAELGGLRLPFLKRAQIAAADLRRAGVGEFPDLERLTMFADNLVPHVLRLDGILEFAPELVARIEREELIEPGSREEVEIRAGAVHAVELIVAAAEGPVTAAAVDQLLWNRGQQPRYKAVPRHRCRTTAY